jgi:tripartite-type tricarboxylate transporter receptor subunit TctC
MTLARRRVLALAVFGPPCFGLPGGTFAQAWPAKPIRLVVPFPAGGGTDIVAREVANKVSSQTKWVFVVDNRPGSGGSIGIDAVAKSPADGYHLVVGQTSNLAINPTLYGKLPYDPLKDLTPIARIGTSPMAIVVGASSPHKTLADVLAAARRNPGSINFATSGNGTVAHLAIELLQKEAGVQLMHVPYKGAAMGLNDVIGGNVELYVSSIPTLIGHIKSGKIRALAVTSLKRVDDLPQVPTIAEAGYKGFEAVTWFGVLGPAHLPKDVLHKIHAEISKALGAEDLIKKLDEQGVDIAGSTPEVFGKLMRDDIAKWGRVVKESGARVE